MTNEELLAAAEPLMEAGDLLVFQCDPPELLQVIEDPVRLVGPIIQDVTKSPLTHAAKVRDPAQGGKRARLTNSTIGAGGSGPQSADVDQVLTMQYPKGRAWLLKLGAPARARISLVKFYAAIGQCEGTVRYDIPGLFEYAAGLKAKMAGKPTRLFCSAYAAFLDECDGVLDPPGESLDPREESPQALADLPLYGSCTQIWGTPLAIHWGLAA